MESRIHIKMMPIFTLITLMTVIGLWGCKPPIIVGPDPDDLQSELVMIEPPDPPTCYLDRRAGDCFFGGQGPQVTLTADLEIRDDGSQLWLHLEMTAVGIEDDDSEGYGTVDYRLYEAPSGKRIVEIQTGAHARVSYLDDDLLADIFETELGRMTIWGNTLFDLCGINLTRSRADISLATVRVRLEW